MKALRAQMNPHFMFNCLNSIRNFMDANDVSKASDYLVRFSKLMRMVLENSNYKEVSLAKDIASLELYIQMEQMRYNHHFDYEIKIDAGIDSENTAIPPLILQPFVENAILHGLNNRKDKGKLELTVERHHEYVKYCIIDNGKKMSDEENKKSNLDVFKKKSMGAGLTSERIDLLNKSKGLKGYVTTTDVINERNEYAGREVEIMLPYEELN
jgi:LytS/YehU family sensor histidine kinase